MSTTSNKPNLFQSMGLGGCSACFAVNFTHRKCNAMACIFVSYPCLWSRLSPGSRIIDVIISTLTNPDGIGSICTIFSFVFGIINFLISKAIETVKTRMQVSGLGVGETASSLYVKEGFASFWKGLGFAWGREIFYTSIKLGGKS